MIQATSAEYQTYQNTRAFYLVVFHDLQNQMLFGCQEILHNLGCQYSHSTASHRTFVLKRIMLTFRPKSRMKSGEQRIFNEVTIQLI